MQVYVLLFGVGQKDTEGIYSLRAVSDDGLPTETIIAFENMEDAIRWARGAAAAAVILAGCAHASMLRIKCCTQNSPARHCINTSAAYRAQVYRSIHPASMQAPIMPHSLTQPALLSAVLHLVRNNVT
jgi:hypothetical protein